MKTLKHHAERAYSEYLMDMDGKNQDEFAEFCGFSISWFNKFLHKERNGSPLTFRKIAEAHNITYKQFKEDAKKYYESTRKTDIKENSEQASVSDILSQVLYKLIVIERDIQLLKKKSSETERRQLVGIGPNGIERRAGDDRRGRTKGDNGDSA